MAIKPTHHIVNRRQVALTFGVTEKCLHKATSTKPFDKNQPWKMQLHQVARLLMCTDEFLAAVLNGEDRAVRFRQAMGIADVRGWSFSPGNPHRIHADARIGVTCFYSEKKLVQYRKETEKVNAVLERLRQAAA